MRLTSRMTMANPVQTDSVVSTRGRAELRRLVGSDSVPTMAATTLDAAGLDPDRTSHWRTVAVSRWGERSRRFWTSFFWIVSAPWWEGKMGHLQTSYRRAGQTRPWESKSGHLRMSTVSPAQGWSRRRKVWLAPVLAGTLVAAGMGVGLALAPDEIVPSAFAETVTATVMPGQVAPVSLGTSLVFDMAYPEAPGEPGLHLVKRLWMRGIDERQWSDLPTDVTFVLQTSADGVGYYLAENWPFDKGYQLVVVQPDSPSCHGDGMPSGAAEEPTLMISTMLRLCQRPSSLATPGLTPVTVDSGFAFTGTGWSTVTDAIEISATTTDPVTVLDQVRQFSFGSDGRLVAAPAGYDDWLHRLDTQAFMGDYSCGSGDAQPIPDPPAPGTVLTHGSWGFPSLANTKPTKTNEDIVVGVWVDEDGVCTVKEGADRLDQAGITLGADGACSYTP